MSDSTRQREFPSGSITEPEFDVFLSYASEDAAWCERLAERLRNEGVRVWFDRWQLKPGDHLEARINEGLENSRKLVAVWSQHYFREDKVWTLAESYSRQHADMLARERPLIPVLIEDCAVKPTFASLIYVDFRNRDDFDLRFRQLVQALDLPDRGSAVDDRLEFREHPLDRAEIGRFAQRKGERFEDEVAKLYELLGFQVKRNLKISGVHIDLMIEQEVGGVLLQAIVGCQDAQVTAEHRDQMVTQLTVVKQAFPICRGIVVSSRGFAPETRAALETLGVTCVVYRDLLQKLVKLTPVVQAIVDEYERHLHERWQDDPERFIRPLLKLEGRDQPVSAVDHLAAWMAKPGSGLLLLLGDLGTGKTTLSRFFAYQLARSFLADPLRHPAPVLIPLRKMRKEVSLQSMVISHFAEHGVTSMDFSRFAHLLRTGKVLLFFDAFDEMADRVNWEVTNANFRELRNATAQWHGKTLITCRTHYFKDRNEEAKVIGRGPSLSQIEADLLREVRGQQNAEVVYLQEFTSDQIRAYLRRARPDTAEQDWQTLVTTHELDDLAKRPLLLELIVRFIDKLKGRHITTANLYNVCVEHWVQREGEDKRRTLLDGEMRRKLMIELAWRLWQDEHDSINYRDLLPFIRRLAADQRLDFGDDEQREAVAREMQAATFLKRDPGGEFTFMHRSFGEYFLARKICDALSSPTPDLSVLAIRRLDRKTIGFLALLDEQDRIAEPLRRALTEAYRPQVSENALQILYWSGRVRCRMEEKIDDLERLRSYLAERLPAGVQLPGAQLQEIVLEAATFAEADFSGANLTKANLNDVTLADANFLQANLTDMRGQRMACQRVDFREAKLHVALFAGGFVDCDFTGAACGASQFATADLERVRGLTLPETVESKILLPVVQLGSPVAIFGVTWSPKGDRLASGGEDGIVRLYRASDGRLLRTLEGHCSAVTSVAFDLEGRWLASGSLDATVKLWDANSGRLLGTLEGHKKGVRSITFHPKGRWLASGSDDQTVVLWKVQSGQLLRKLEGHKKRIRSVAFDPQGHWLASGSDDQTIVLWDAKSGEQLLTLEGHRNGVRSVSFDPKARWLASGSTDHSVRVWGVDHGQPLRTLEGHRNWVLSVAFDPQGRRLASGSEDLTAKLWKVDEGRLDRTLEGHENRVLGVAFDPQGRRLATASSDHTVKLWEAEHGQMLRTLEGHRNHVLSVAFDPQGRWLASGTSNHTVRVWTPGSGRLVFSLAGHDGRVRSVAYDTDGTCLASGSEDQTVKLWDSESGRLLRTLEGHRNGVWSVAFDPRGRRLVSGGWDQAVKLWDTDGGRVLHTLEGHRNLVLSVAFEPHGHLLASGSSDRTVKLWDPDRGQLLRTLEGHMNLVWSVAFDPDGSRLATGSSDRTVILWETTSGRLLRTLEGHQNWVQCVAFDAQGCRLASGSSDHTVKVWDVDSGQLLRTLEGHVGPVRTVCFAPHGRYLVAAGDAGRLQFWDVERGETFLSLYAFGPGAWLALLPDGRFDGTPEALRYLCYTERDSLTSYTAEELVHEFHSPDAVREVLARYSVPDPNGPAAAVAATRE